MRTINLAATIDVDDIIPEAEAVSMLMTLVGHDMFQHLAYGLRDKFHPKEVSCGTDQVITLPATETQKMTPRMKFIRREGMVDQLIYILNEIEKLNADLKDPEWSADIVCLINHHRHRPGKEIHDTCITETFHTGSFAGFMGAMLGTGMLVKKILDEQG